METRLLCVGDVHLGRRPGRLPAGLESEHGVRPADLRPAAAWRRVVERAIELRVDAVLLAGDVVDDQNAFFEAYGPLREGVRRLVDAGIDVCAVAGNHDVVVLPRLADEIAGFHLLGRGGSWKTHVVRRDGVPLARVLGWSFPTRHVEVSPLAKLPTRFRELRFDDGADDDLPTLGLLHCDLDSSDRRYAPVSSAELSGVGLPAWLLGHQHAPSIAGGGRPVGYLGSLSGLDPTETGAHGAWLATARPGGWELALQPLAPLRWERIELACDGLETAAELEAALARSLRARHERIAGELDGTLAVGCRLRLYGRTPLARAERRRVLEAFRADSAGPIDDVLYFVDEVRDEAQKRIDLERLGRGSDPAGILAARILELESGSGRAAELVAEARARMQQQLDHANLRALGRAQLDDGDVRALLLRAAQAALEELLAQKPAAQAVAPDRTGPDPAPSGEGSGVPA